MTKDTPTPRTDGLPGDMPPGTIYLLNFSGGLLKYEFVSAESYRQLSECKARENEEARSRTLVNAAVVATERAEAAEARLAEVSAWAKDLLVYLDVEVEALPEAEYKIYEEGYDKTIAGLQVALANQVAAAQK